MQAEAPLLEALPLRLDDDILHLIAEHLIEESSGLFEKRLIEPNSDGCIGLTARMVEYSTDSHRG